MKQKVYTIENLDCAHCAANVERKIADMPEVKEAALTFATKQLRITADNPDAILDKVIKVAKAAEPEVEIMERQAAPKKAAKTESKKSSFLTGEQKKELLWIGIGVVFMAVGFVISYLDYYIPSFVVFTAAYLILGKNVLLTAGKNILHGKIFDENFLMSIATLGAFALRDFKEAAGVMLFYRVGEFVEELAVERSRSQIMEAVDMRPETVTVVHSHGKHEIPAEEAKVGELFEIKPGDRIPLDGVIIEGESRLDTAPITGEPVPVTVRPGSEVLSGCINTSGLLLVRATKELKNSMVTKILDSVENAAANKPRFERFITRFSRFYTPAVVLVAVLTAIIPSIITGDWKQWVTTALTFLVISCPCALVLSVPLSFFTGIGAGSKKGILFKGGLSLEALAKVKTVIMDKTGTLTKGDFTVQRVVTDGAMSEDDVLRLAASAESSSTHPIATSILHAAKHRELPLEKIVSLEEIAGLGLRAVLPSGEILIGSKRLLTNHHITTPDGADSYGTEVFVAKDGKYIGYIAIDDTLKADAKSAVSRLKAHDVTTVMLTGDSEENARAIASEVGLDQYQAKLLPNDKLERLTDIRKRDGAVMFVGDGINDAPVLAGADVGAAMGSGADSAIEAADVVFMNSSVEAIPQSMDIANNTIKIAKQNVAFALSIKFLVMILGYLGYANMWMAVFADSGVALLCVLNSIRILYKK